MEQFQMDLAGSYAYDRDWGTCKTSWRCRYGWLR